MERTGTKRKGESKIDDCGDRAPPGQVKPNGILILLANILRLFNMCQVHVDYLM